MSSKDQLDQIITKLDQVAGEARSSSLRVDAMESRFAVASDLLDRVANRQLNEPVFEKDQQLRMFALEMATKVDLAAGTDFIEAAEKFYDWLQKDDELPIVGY